MKFKHLKMAKLSYWVFFSWSTYEKNKGKADPKLANKLLMEN